MYLICLGFTLKTPAGVITAHVMLLECSLDLPARAIVMNMKLFNAICGYCYCEDNGVTSPTNHLHCWWPFDSISVRRSHASLLQDAQQAADRGTTKLMLTFVLQVKGVNGPSLLCLHKPFNLVDGFVIDMLHCVSWSICSAYSLVV